MPARKNKKPSLNLLPRDDFDKTALGRIMRWALTTFRMIVIFVEFIVIAGFVSRFWFDIKISDLDEEMRQKAALISSKSSFEREFRKVQQKLTFIKEISRDENKLLPVMNEIVDSLPRDASLYSVNKVGSVLTITGTTSNNVSISTFVANLDQKDGFSRVLISSIESKADSPLTEFSINVILATELETAIPT